MATIYLDCSSGICGNMLLGALLDLGYSKDDFSKKIKETKLPVEIEIKRVKRNSIDSILVEVNVLKKSPARRKKDVFKVIDSLPFSSAVKDKSREVFERLFSAEAKVHGLDKNKAHLHEAGANDAIVDVVGSLFLLEELGIKRVFSSPVNVGGGFVESSHRKLPVPAPATAELLKNVPVYLQGNSELVTPTGAALLVSITEQFTPHLNFIFEKIGYGAGSRDSDDLPNVLRIFYGKIEDNNLEKIIDIEFEVDDMEPQLIGIFAEEIRKLGALEIFYQSVYMKKGRPGVLVKILCKKEDFSAIKNAIFRYTSTIGFRFKEMERVKMERWEEKFDYEGEEVRVKISRFGDIEKIKPEFDDCVRISLKKGKNVSEIINEIIYNYRKRKDGLKKD